MLRFFELLPGLLAWGTFIFLGIASYFLPRAVGIFVVLFDVYWLLKSVYLSIHMRAAFRKMRANMKVDWVAKLKELEPVTYGKITDNEEKDFSLVIHHWSDVYHLIIFPIYREPYEVVRESFESLVQTTYPKERLLVVLATEERAYEEVRETVARVKSEFGGLFGGFLITTHPANLEGELSGKGSNIAWATREAQRLLVDPLVLRNANSESFAHVSQHGEINARRLYENILVSAFDIDTQAPPDYFARLTHAFVSVPDPHHAIYQPIPLFTNNIYHAPFLARVVAFSATFWQMMQQARPERLTTFSSQSVPLSVLLDVGFWHKDVVSEDSRIFWQAYLHYGGDFRVEPLHFPVMMDANVASGFWKTMRNIYLQQRRWGWGVENVPYILNGFFRPHNESIPVPRAKRRYWTFHVVEGFHSWATNILIIFFLGWLPTLIGGNQFRTTLLSYSIPEVTRILMFLAMIGIVTAVVLSISLLPPRPAWFRRRHMSILILEWLLMPLTLIVFGALPALEAQTRLMLGGKWRLGFWVTPKSRKGVGGGREDSPK
ncbi:MAG: glycosyltransferase family 2 protein [Patescibacteria group bacterium]|nr:glycosyltransferase family 2 protein [Patescibacteria group bacterium]